MSAYNVLTVLPGTLTASELYGSTCRALGMHLERTDFIAAVKRLLEMRLLFIDQTGEDGQDRFRCYDQLRRRIRWRDRTGDGWNGWMMEDLTEGPIPVAQVVRQQVDGNSMVREIQRQERNYLNQQQQEQLHRLDRNLRG